MHYHIRRARAALKIIMLLSLLLPVFLSQPPATAQAAERIGMPAPAHAPKYLFTHLTTSDGLPQNHVSAILQDRQGFMWFGTEEGLSRYDGYHFTIFKYDQLDRHSISSNIITDLMEDRDGAIWVATMGGGVDRFDPASQTFTRYEYHPDNPAGLSSPNIIALAQGPDGTIWLGAWQGGHPPGKRRAGNP